MVSSLQFLIPLLHIFQADNLQRTASFSLTVDQLINLSEAARINQTDLRGMSHRGERHQLMQGGRRKSPTLKL